MHALIISEYKSVVALCVLYYLIPDVRTSPDHTWIITIVEVSINFISEMHCLCACSTITFTEDLRLLELGQLLLYCACNNRELNILNWINFEIQANIVA